MSVFIFSLTHHHALAHVGHVYLHGQEVLTGWAEIRRLRDPVTLYVNGPDSSQL